MNIKISKVGRIFLIVLLGFFLITLLLLAGIFNSYLKSTETPTIKIFPENKYTKTLKVVADIDYSPYSFYDENDTVSGHDIEFIYALANKMEVNVEISLLDWKTANEKLISKEVDIILGMTYNPQLHSKFGLSIPINSDPFVTFTKKGNKAAIDKFYGSNIATLKGSAVNDLIISPYKLENATTTYNTYTEAFQSIEDNTNNFVLCPFSVGRINIKDQGFTDIVANGPVLVNNSNCIAVNIENTQLLDDINATILLLLEDGTINDINDRWLSEYVNEITFAEYLGENLQILLIFFGIILALVSIIFVFIYNNQKDAKNKAILNEKCMLALAEQTSKVIFELDFATNKIVSMSNFNTIFGRDPVTVSGAQDALNAKMIHEDDTDAFQDVFIKINNGENVNNKRFRIRDFYEKYNWCELSAVVIDDFKGIPYKAIGTLENIQHQVQKEETLTHKSKTDLLTGLNNKATTEEMIIETLANGIVENEYYVLMIIDIDNFKSINDTLGHMYGDNVLKSLANNLKKVFRATDIIGRVGGDEMFVFIKNPPSKGSLFAKVRDINNLFRNTYNENGAICSISASIGIAFFPNHAHDFETLYKKADIALYKTKQNGKDGFTVYDKSFD